MEMCAGGSGPSAVAQSKIKNRTPVCKTNRLVNTRISRVRPQMLHRLRPRVYHGLDRTANQPSTLGHQTCAAGKTAVATADEAGGCRQKRQRARSATASARIAKTMRFRPL